MIRVLQFVKMVGPYVQVQPDVIPGVSESHDHTQVAT